MPREGIEPPTYRLRAGSSTTELARRKSGRRDSNSRSSAPKADGLATTLRPGVLPRWYAGACQGMAALASRLSTVQLSMCPPSGNIPDGGGPKAYAGAEGVEPVAGGFGDRSAAVTLHPIGVELLLANRPLKRKKPPPGYPAAAHVLKDQS